MSRLVKVPVPILGEETNTVFVDGAPFSTRFPERDCACSIGCSKVCGHG
jgi:hypothetical protein